MGIPEEVKPAAEGYRDEMDVIGAFLEDCSIIDEDFRAKSGTLYGAYTTWCEENTGLFEAEMPQIRKRPNRPSTSMGICPQKTP